MHDIDRTQLEWEQSEYETGEYEVAQAEGEYGEVPLHETHELELANELLEVTNEAELEEFLGNVFKAVGSTLGRFARSDTGRVLTGIVRSAARDALPTIGSAIGDWVAPGRGGTIGSRLAQQAGALLGLELEGLSPQDQEFEAARQFVRFAGSAYANAASAPRDADPVAVAQQAAAAAGQRFAPGIAGAGGPTQSEAEEEYRFRRAYAPQRFRRPSYRRRYGPPPRRRAYGYPGYAGAPYPAAPPYADYGPPEEPQWGDDRPAGQADGGGDEELGTAYQSSTNGFPAGARQGRWVKHGRVLIVYGG
jgi:hypothetical protein